MFIRGKLRDLVAALTSENDRLMRKCQALATENRRLKEELSIYRTYTP